MSFGYFEIFGIAADCFQVLMIVLIVFLLVRYRKKTQTPNWSDWAASQANPFMHEFLLQSLKHQSEQAFNQIEKTIQTERTHLMQLFELSDQQLKQGGADFSEPEPEAAAVNPEAAPSSVDELPLSDEHEISEDRYEHISQLAADGMNARRIAKQLAIPLGEVELVLKMAAASNSNLFNEASNAGVLRRRAAR